MCLRLRNVFAQGEVICQLEIRIEFFCEEQINPPVSQKPPTKIRLFRAPWTEISVASTRVIIIRHAAFALEFPHFFDAAQQATSLKEKKTKGIIVRYRHSVTKIKNASDKKCKTH